MKWADLDPNPGVDTRDYVQEGKNNAIGLAGYLGGTVTAIPSLVEAGANVANILRKRPLQTVPGSFTWLGQQTGLKGHPLYEIGGIGYAGTANFGFRQGIARPVREMVQAEETRRLHNISERLVNHPAYDPNDWSPFGDMINETLVNHYLKQDRFLRTKAAAERVGKAANIGVDAPRVASPGDTAIQYGVGAERAHRNIENRRNEPFPGYRRDPLQQGLRR